MQALILLDKPVFDLLTSSNGRILNFSHNRHAYQFAHECINLGISVFFSPVQDNHLSREYIEIFSIYPKISLGRTAAYTDIDPDMVASVFPESLNVKNHFPRSKIIAIHAAIHWVESPELFQAEFVFDLITAVRYNIDFILTQNDRMKSLLLAAYGLLAKWPYADRMLVCPLGIVESEEKTRHDRLLARKVMNLSSRDIAIVNSGGIWRWTDFDIFLESFCEYVVRNPNSRFRLYTMGFGQSDNSLHTSYHDTIVDILWRYRSLVGRYIFPENIWAEGSKIVDMYAAGADIGLNVNQDGLEHWQSFRVRFLEYMTQGTPVINTSGDAMSAGPEADGMFTVRAGDRQGYLDVLAMIENRPSLLAEKAMAMTKAAAAYDSRLTYGKTIRHILDTPGRDENDTSPWGPCVLDIANARASSEAMSNARAKLMAYLSTGL